MNRGQTNLPTSTQLLQMDLQTIEQIHHPYWTCFPHLRRPSFDLIANLPTPILHMIFQKLDCPTLITFSYVSHRWRDMILEDKEVMEKFTEPIESLTTAHILPGTQSNILRRMFTYSHTVAFANPSREDIQYFLNS